MSIGRGTVQRVGNQFADMRKGERLSAVALAKRYLPTQAFDRPKRGFTPPFRVENQEVKLEDLAHLAAADQDRLGEHRETELATAMALLGVTDYRFLGEPGEYRDSGMAGEPSNDHPAAFCRVPVDEAAARLVQTIR